MANRALAAKMERAATQRREAAHVEFTKPAYLAVSKVAARAELAAMVAAFKGAIVVGEPGRYVAPEGKGHRVASRACYGNGERRHLGYMLQRDIVVTAAQR